MAQNIRKKGSKETPAVSTASLPDIIFMLLFFFMVSTSMREVEMQVKLELPNATEAQKLEKKSLASYIYIGPPNDMAKYGTAPRIQLNNAYASIDQIGEFIAAERDKLKEEERPDMTTVIKVNKITHMGMVTDLKQALRRANALNIIYASNKDNKQASESPF